jgi:ankyrin repeat protein
VQLGADKEATTSGGGRALHWAAVKGHVETMRVLVLLGANVGARTGAGETALQVIQRCNSCECVRVGCGTS